MNGFVPVRCPQCRKPAFTLLYGIGEGVHCGYRITASLDKGGELRILKVDRPVKRIEDRGHIASLSGSQKAPVTAN